MLNWLDRKIRDFVNHRLGSVAIMASVALPIVIIGVGIAIDFLRFQTSQEAAQKAIDSATLSAAIDLAQGEITLSQLEQTAEDIFRLNLANVAGAAIDPPLDGADETQGGASEEEDNPPGPASVAISGFNIDIDEAQGVVRANTKIEVPTLFSSLVGINSLSANVSSTSDFGSTSLEVAFVLDTTGSMIGSRIRDLRHSMTRALNLLLPDSRFKDRKVRVSIVPFATGVNLGQYHVPAVGAGTVSATQSVNTCVSEREGVNAFNDVAPVQGKVNTYFETDQVIRRKRTAIYSCPRAQLMPLTDDRQVLQNVVNSLDAAGVTAGQIGVNWGINTISGAYRDFWPEESKPAEYGAADTRKILVFMTDGAINTAFYNTRRFDTVLGVEGRTRRAAKNATIAFCDLAKEEERGIEVYTIAFQAGRSAENLLAGCASDNTNEFPGPHFHTVERGESIGGVFETIIRQILKIRLTG